MTKENKPKPAGFGGYSELPETDVGLKPSY